MKPIKNINTLTTPHDLIVSLQDGPTLTPACPEFWAAYNCALKGKVRQAQDILTAYYLTPDGYPNDSPRIRRLSAYSDGRHCGVDDLDLIDILASARLTDVLKDLFASGRISAIHAIHGDIEASPVDTPNPMLKAKRGEVQALLKLYELEEGVLINSVHKTKSLERWLENRNARAREYDEVLAFCHSYAATPTSQINKANPDAF